MGNLGNKPFKMGAAVQLHNVGEDVSTCPHVPRLEAQLGGGLWTNTSARPAERTNIFWVEQMYSICQWQDTAIPTL